MKLIVGLGNPGSKYDSTRHNLGFMVVDKLISEQRGLMGKLISVETPLKLILGKEEVLFLKPKTFMNESGASVAQTINFYKVNPTDLWVVHDDLDLPFGTVRVSFNSSSAGHRGVESIIERLGTKEFHRLRLGVGRPPEPIPAEAFVLQPFSAEEQKALPEILSQAVATLKTTFST